MAHKKGSDQLALQNAAKTLLANIRFASIDTPIKTITITSSRPNEGKTTVAVCLAKAAATSGRHVALVECDMRHRSLATHLTVRGARGMYAVLSGREALDDALTPTHQKNLDFLDVEPGIPNPADVIASKRFRKLVSELRGDYDLVIFDTPPVGGFVDAAELGALTDGTLFVVRENFTKRDVATDALGQLRKAGANVLGTVMNCCESGASGFYDYYYHEDEAPQAMSAALEDLPREEHARAVQPASSVQPPVPAQPRTVEPAVQVQAPLPAQARAAEPACPVQPPLPARSAESARTAQPACPVQQPLPTRAAEPAPAAQPCAAAPRVGAADAYVPARNNPYAH